MNTETKSWNPLKRIDLKPKERMYLKLSNWFATTTTKTTETWGNGARICRAIDRRPTDWSKNKERLIKNIAEIETIAEEFGLEVLVSVEGEMEKTPFEKIIKEGYITPAKFRAKLAKAKGCDCTGDMQNYACKAHEYCIHKITPAKNINDT